MEILKRRMGPQRWICDSCPSCRLSSNQQHQNLTKNLKTYLFRQDYNYPVSVSASDYGDFTRIMAHYNLYYLLTTYTQTTITDQATQMIHMVDLRFVLMFKQQWVNILQFSAGLTKCNQSCISEPRTPRHTQIVNSNAVLTHGNYGLVGN